MNYIAQSKRIIPNAKSCDWCKHYIYRWGLIEGEPIDYGACELGAFKNVKGYFTKKLIYKDHCKRYRFSKENFKKWKEDYLNLQKFYDEELGRLEDL